MLSPQASKAGALALAVLLFAPLPSNAEETILQYFNTDWTEIERRLPEIAEAGYTSLWLPPPFKGASGTYSVGFDTFDRFDIGDKDQMGTVPTRYGTGDELKSLVTAAHRFGMKVYFDNVMAHNGGPLDDGTDAGQLYPSLPGFVPEDFHLGRDGVRWRKFSDSINYQDEWQVLNRNPFGWDIAHEDWNTSFDPDGLDEGSDYPKHRGVRHPGLTWYYPDLDLAVAQNFPGDDVFTFADKEPYQDVGYNGGTGAGNGRFDWNDSDSDGQHDPGEASEPFDDTGIDPTNSDRRNAGWGFGDSIYNMGDPVEEDVNQMLFRQVRWFVDAVKPDGFRLDAVKHVPDGFFGKQDGGDRDYVNWGYNGQIQEQFNVTRGHDDWGNHRDSVFINTLARDDALLYGEHLGSPPDWPPYLAAGMRIANDDFINAVGGFNGIGGSLSGYDQPGHGTVGTGIGVAYPLSHDNNFMDGSIRGAAHRYMLLREGLPIVYTDGYNVEGPPSYFPKPSYVPFLGQYAQRWVTEPLEVRVDFVRGQQIPRWSDGDFAAWEMRDKRENPSMNNADGTVMFVMMARAFTGGQARGAITDFPDGARLRNYSEFGGPFHVTVWSDGTVHDDGGNLPVVPSGGYFAFSWDNPRPPRVFGGDPEVDPIEIYQNGSRAPWMDHYRFDGRDGDPDYAHTVRIPRITDGSNLRFLARTDGSAANILMKLDGGIDINSQLSLGPSSGDLRDNPPPSDRFIENEAQDIFTGYEQMQFRSRVAEKFAATNVSRNVIGSQGAETWEYSNLSFTRNDGGGEVTDTGSVDWVYHDPENDSDPGGAHFIHFPGLQIEIRAKIGYTADEPEHVYIYYTLGGNSYPEGSNGVGVGETLVVEMVMNQFGTPDGGGTPEYWVGTIPPVDTTNTLRYKIGVVREDPAPPRFPFNGRDIALKRGMQTLFEIDNFDANAVAYHPHNDHGEMAVGLEEGFHILRTKAFLARDGRSSIWNTQAQTFYYDAALPSGQVLFPHEGDSIGGSSYGAVAISDETVTEVCYSILDSDVGNDDPDTGNGAGNWANASEISAPSQLGNSGFTKEWRFDYVDIPTTGTAQIRVRFKEQTSSDDNALDDANGHFTTITVNVNTGLDVNYRFGFPVADGESLGEGYVAKVLFDRSLSFGIPDAQLLSEFTVTIDGVPLPESALAIIRDETPADDALAITLPNVYDGNDTEHEIRAVHTRGDASLAATRTFLAQPAALPDSDGDGLPDAWEAAHGLEVNNPNGIHGGSGDYDADGVSNLAEFLAGTNPLAFELPGFRITSIAPSGADSLLLTFPVIADRDYRVLYSDDLTDWLEAAAFPVLTDNESFTWLDDGTLTGTPPGETARRFYTVEISAP